MSDEPDEDARDEEWEREVELMEVQQGMREGKTLEDAVAAATNKTAAEEQARMEDQESSESDAQLNATERARRLGEMGNGNESYTDLMMRFGVSKEYLEKARQDDVAAIRMAKREEQEADAREYAFRELAPFADPTELNQPVFPDVGDDGQPVCEGANGQYRAQHEFPYGRGRDWIPLDELQHQFPQVWGAPREPVHPLRGGAEAGRGTTIDADYHQMEGVAKEIARGVPSLSGAKLRALEKVACKIGTRGKGVLKADWSAAELGRELEARRLADTPSNRRDLWAALAQHSHVTESLSAVVLHPEHFELSTVGSTAQYLPDVLGGLGVLAGARGDKGTCPVPSGGGERCGAPPRVPWEMTPTERMMGEMGGPIYGKGRTEHPEFGGGGGDDLDGMEESREGEGGGGGVEERWTTGLRDLYERCAAYQAAGASFVTWRSDYSVSPCPGGGSDRAGPSRECVARSARDAAVFCRVAMAAGLVPVVHAQVSPDGPHDCSEGADALQSVLLGTFAALQEHRVPLTAVVLMTGFARHGGGCDSIERTGDPAAATLSVLGNTVPASVPCVLLTDDGLGEEEAALLLNEVNRVADLAEGASGRAQHPWTLSFGYGGALTRTPLEALGAHNATHASFKAGEMARVAATAQLGAWPGAERGMEGGMYLDLVRHKGKEHQRERAEAEEAQKEFPGIMGGADEDGGGLRWGVASRVGPR